jgi:hypothetical protein
VTAGHGGVNEDTVQDHATNALPTLHECTVGMQRIMMLTIQIQVYSFNHARQRCP